MSTSLQGSTHGPPPTTSTTTTPPHFYGSNGTHATGAGGGGYHPPTYGNNGGPPSLINHTRPPHSQHQHHQHHQHTAHGFNMSAAAAANTPNVKGIVFPNIVVEDCVFRSSTWPQGLTRLEKKIERDNKWSELGENSGDVAELSQFYSAFYCRSGSFSCLYNLAA